MLDTSRQVLQELFISVSDQNIDNNLIISVKSKPYLCEVYENYRRCADFVFRIL